MTASHDTSHGHASHDSNDGSAKERKIPWKLIGICTGVAALFAIVSTLNTCSHSQGRQILPAQQASTGQPGVQVPVAAMQPVQPTAKCPPFSSTGASCEVDESGSGWISFVPGSQNGLDFCILPNIGSGVYSKIEYVDASGQIQEFDPNNVQTAGASAYRFFPKQKLMMTYSLAKPCG